MKNLLQIGNKLSKHGNTATSIETLGKFLEGEGFQIHYASSKKNKAIRLLDMIVKTVKYSKKVDYVLIDTYSTMNFWYAFIISQLCRMLRVKYIPKLLGGKLPKRIIKSKFFADLIFKNAYANIAPSNYLFEAFKANGYTNVKYIPNTIDLQMYAHEPKEFRVPKLLWVRSFSQIYNPVMAVAVFVSIKKVFPDAELCMVGPRKDNSFEATEQFANEHQVKVRFTNKLSKYEWITLSKDYNVFINTTHFDNTPVSVMEAMALGLPVVSTNVGGIPYLLHHNTNALLVEDGDAEGMTSQIIKLFYNPDLPRRISANAEETVRNFDWQIVKKQWIDLLR